MTDADRTVERIDQGEWAIVVALLLAGLGLTVGSQVLVAAATLPLLYVGAAIFGTPPNATVRLSRTLSIDDDGGTVTDGGRSDDETAVSGNPGQHVSVRTTIQNTGSEPIIDLRVIDGVPEELSVTAGSPRACVTLEPLETVTLEYTLSLQRGEYVFDAATVRARDVSATVTETWAEPVEGQTELQCTPSVESVALGTATTEHTGAVPTDEGGAGIEFHSVREYEPSDPVNAIDWRRYAGSRELATVEYRAERSTHVVCVVDSRPSQFRAATTEQLPAIDLSVDAAERAFETLVDAGHPTGVARLGSGAIETIPPGTGPETAERATRLLESISNSNKQMRYYTRTSSNNSAAELITSLPGEAQVYLFSSFVDDEPLELIEGLCTRGYPVRIISPDVTDGDDSATKLEGLDRDTRLARARATGARVVDWSLERPLRLVLADAIGEVKHR
ncbi:DUF58 domain-containing protein [Natronolimnobius sp. AArcel1]|uniref:DUF58 domain-containing protein n=1 Tax=Natronolimnobius sp. AArcel1 TaxID=1679093 RepID=UPI0013EA1120|nr:DUF58 domain-containing protein [Natronolimnobius sp. AArcel1]NGM68287.1 DUF58 domain-containing protein [Natronolimnobius sp. AArcel1]